MADKRNGATISEENLLAKKIVVHVPQITTPGGGGVTPYNGLYGEALREKKKMTRRLPVLTIYS